MSDHIFYPFFEIQALIFQAVTVDMAESFRNRARPVNQVNLVSVPGHPFAEIEQLAGEDVSLGQGIPDKVYLPRQGQGLERPVPQPA